MDEGWGSHDPQKSVVVSSHVNNDLQKADFIINNEKSIWKPFTRLEWLRFIWDLEASLIQIHEGKNTDLKSPIRNLIESKNPVSARALARVVGRIISMSFSLGNICQIMSRNMHLPILNRSTWDGPVDLNDGGLYELKFWLDNIDTLPFRTLAPIDRTPDKKKNCIC